MSISKIEKDVLEFLHGFFQIDKGSFQFELLSLFPIACCEYSSMMLARFLVENKGYNIADVLMIKDQSVADVCQLHLWLKVNGVIVDITAGQFNEAEKSIIIDEHGSWHNKFFYVLNAYTPSTDFENYVDELDQPTLENDYLMIVQQIHQNSTTL
ncbi:hypothetical protein [Acinetobacter johnsonii]|uniref:hypothetical protein n=1 Tax=Acinetobacter johnsonii TaxID=40214 RepID=UPI001F19B26A|nr:hypothetical protein [Acinetobacter johnsonii]UJA00539.1 hypothetical protein GBN93_06070 [Acinetobacter johnsonii]